MGDEQTGIKIADWFAGSRGLGSGSAALAEKITEALAEARKEALEEAAQACEALYEKPIHCEEVGMCVAAIRSLAAASKAAGGGQ